MMADREDFTEQTLMDVSERPALMFDAVDPESERIMLFMKPLGKGFYRPILWNPYTGETKLRRVEKEISAIVLTAALRRGETPRFAGLKVLKLWAQGNRTTEGPFVLVRGDETFILDPQENEIQYVDGNLEQ